MDTPNAGEEQVDVVDIGYLLQKLRNVAHERFPVMLEENIEIDAVPSASVKGFCVASTNEIHQNMRTLIQE